MATQRDCAYDHPAYTAPVVYSGSSTAGANGTTTRFAAFTASRIKAVCLSPNIASTSATQPLLFSKSGTSTATRTLSALTSASVAVFTNVLATDVALAQGDQFWVAHGTDATVSLSVAIETYPNPGATLAY